MTAHLPAQSSPSARRVPPAGGASGRRRTATVRFGSAHLRVRVKDSQVLWFVRDLGSAVGFRPPPKGSAVPQVLMATAELWSLMAASGYQPPAAFTAWAAEVVQQLTRPRAAVALRAVAAASPGSRSPV